MFFALKTFRLSLVASAIVYVFILPPLHTHIYHKRHPIATTVITVLSMFYHSDNYYFRKSSRLINILRAGCHRRQWHCYHRDNYRTHLWHHWFDKLRMPRFTSVLICNFKACHPAVYMYSFVVVRRS